MSAAAEVPAIAALSIDAVAPPTVGSPMNPKVGRKENGGASSPSRKIKEAQVADAKFNPPSSGPIKMHYFPIAGRGELIRLICAAGDLELVAGEELTAEQKLEFCSPGSVPLLDHGGFKLAQSNAIECYVAGLVPKFAALTPQQKATDHMVTLIKGDMLGEVAKEAFGGKDAAVITKACDKWLTVLEAKIPTEGFINGLPFPTVADLAVYNICTGYIPFGASYKIASYDVSKFPKVSALAERTKEHACLKDFESATQSAAAFGL